MSSMLFPSTSSSSSSSSSKNNDKYHNDDDDGKNHNSNHNDDPNSSSHFATPMTSIVVSTSENNNANNDTTSPFSNNNNNNDSITTDTATYDDTNILPPPPSITASTSSITVNNSASPHQYNYKSKVLKSSTKSLLDSIVNAEDEEESEEEEEGNQEQRMNSKQYHESQQHQNVDISSSSQPPQSTPPVITTTTTSTATTTTTTAANHNNNMNDKENNDHDTINVEHATQAAALAALVTAATREHKIENSPSVAATYVKDLMAKTTTASSSSSSSSSNSVVIVDNNSNSNSNRNGMDSKERHEQQQQQQQHQQQQKQKQNHMSNLIVSNKTFVQLHLVQQYLQDEWDHYLVKEQQQKSVDTNNKESKDDFINNNDDNIMASSLSSTTEANTDQNDMKKQNQKIMISSLLPKMQKDTNHHFLKQLLILTNHTCIEKTYNNNNNNNNSNNNNNNNVQTQHNQESKQQEQEQEQQIIEQQRAKVAASKIISLLYQVDASFHYLSSFLPNSKHCSNKEEFNTISVINNDNDDVGLQDYDPNIVLQDNDDENDIDFNKDNCIPDINDMNSNRYNDEEDNDHRDNDQEDFLSRLSSTGHYIIPDLLPSCMPDQGDATNNFFKDIQAVKEIMPRTTMANLSKTHSDEMNNESSNMSPSKMDPATPKNVSRNAASMFSSVFSSVKTGGIGMNRRLMRGKSHTTGPDENGDNYSEIEGKSDSKINDPSPSPLSSEIGIDYNVEIESEMLGLTVENILERTVVRTVIEKGAARKAGTKVGSLIVKVGTVETTNLTHFETIDELRQSKRPLRLVLRKISKDALKLGRDEMGRLIKGGGFGNSIANSFIDRNIDAKHHDEQLTNKNEEERLVEHNTSLHRYSSQNDPFYNFLQERWLHGAKTHSTSKVFGKKEESVAKAGAKLSWLLCLLVLGMEREAEKMRNYNTDQIGESKKISSHYSAEDYMDAAKSVSKILHDYVDAHFSRENKSVHRANAPQISKKRSKQMPPPHIQDRQRNAVPGASRRNSQQSFVQSSVPPSEIALLKIGDVLHRARSFLADPNSPPAALIRSELIALLCDILDLDTDMALSEQEGASSTAGSRGGAINDLGSAGSLLKLIVLNCSVMRSVGCIDDEKNCHSLHAGNRFLAVVHRLAASSSSRSARMTACSLGPVLWGHLDFPHQLQLRGVITRALHDVDVTVRKSTATVLHEIAELVFDSRAVPWLVLMCERAMSDPEPQLRSAAMTLTWHLAEHLPNAFFGDARQGSRSRRRLPPRTDPAFAEVYLLQCKLLPVATRLAEDVGASVRLAVAAQCDRLANALGEHWQSVIVDLLQALLGDPDDLVRAEAVLCIPRLAENILLDSSSTTSSSSTVLESLLPLAIKLLKDPSIDVRAALATAAGEMLTLLVGLQRNEDIMINSSMPSSHKRHIDDTLIPLLQKLLQDANPEVTSSALRAITNTSRGHVREISNRRNEDDSISLSSSHQSFVIEKKDPVFIPVLSEKQVLRLMPTLSKLANSGQWRVRQSAVEIVPALLGCTQKLEFRTEIAQLCVTLMSDAVDAVRRTAAECLCLSGSSVGDGHIDSQEWVKTVVMPHIEACRDSPKSKQRLLSLKMVEIILTQGLCHSGNKMMDNIMNSSINDSESPSVSLVRRHLEVLNSLSTDDTANVRLNVGRVFCSVIVTLEENDLNFTIKVLDSQMEKEKNRPSGRDRDVCFFAKRAKKLAQERLMTIKNESIIN